uniref:Platelet-derived growth factor (PDGF) family profile domain-containing protein n=1 Tax=Cyprinodon variegatus TaxID=28743 RepID=A0A3Q2E8U3_CYPVA
MAYSSVFNVIICCCSLEDVPVRAFKTVLECLHGALRPHSDPFNCWFSPDQLGLILVRKLEVLTKAECKPVEKLVNLKEKLSDYVNHIYVPSCVPLFHCSGCAADEALECYPTAERNVTIECLTYKLKPLGVVLSDWNHARCLLCLNILNA